MRPQKGVVGWVQQRLLKVPRLKENISSSSTASPSTPAQPLTEAPLGGSEQTSPRLLSDRLRFAVSYVFKVLDLLLACGWKNACDYDAPVD